MTVAAIHSTQDPAIAHLSSKNFSSLTLKINAVVDKCFHLFQGIFYLAYGTIELLHAIIASKRAYLGEKIKSALNWFYRTIASFCKKIISFSGLHGCCYIGVGVCEFMLGMNHLKWINLGIAVPAIAIASSSFFIAANVCLLVYSASNFYKSCRLPENAGESENDRARLQKISNTLSFLSALNNIVGTVLLLCGVRTAIIAMFAVLAMTEGMGKIIVDMFF